MWKKKIAAAVLSLSLVLPLPAYASVQKDGVHITIMHTNDMHARVKSTDDEGKTIGLDWIAGAIWQQKAADEDTLALDAGDTLHGVTLVNVSQGSNMAMFMNLAGYDAMTPGNHDFSYGTRRLLELAKMLNFPLLSANILDKEQKQYIFLPYKSFAYNGVKVAVVGLTTPEVPIKTNPLNVTDLVFADPVAAAKDLVPKLRATHDVVIGLMHMGLDKSSAVTSESVAKAVPGFDIIIDGHSHTTLPHGKKVGKTLICQTGHYGHNLGKVELVVKDHKLRKVKASLLDRKAVEKAAKTPDEGVAAAIQEIDTQVNNELGVVVAESPRGLTAQKEIVRTQESELGNLLADALRNVTGADIGMVNGGSIRAGLPQGSITKSAVLNILPFNNRAIKLEVTGAEVKAVLEHSVEHLPDAFGGFLNVSGLIFDLHEKAAVGQRVSNVLVNGEPLDNSKKYTLALNDFTAAGGDGYDMLKGAQIAGDYGSLENIFIEYLQHNGLEGIETGRINVVK
ncbi:bifunctional UDP-sugar hydrolase/5'-nucleotidase [Selenomonas sp. AE3005]|uniref:bifunctional metallophosphatase/5'-nucleotidase n=1 Tax=Selenomonas sp. AE3005 TaxID=1485543 RepID=UPI00068EE89A|nr:bifunctional UDP-sugar hydrolase/5'-nucleotidase [Selenomonas sp. AE3005]